MRKLTVVGVDVVLRRRLDIFSEMFSDSIEIAEVDWSEWCMNSEHLFRRMCKTASTELEAYLFNFASQDAPSSNALVQFEKQHQGIPIMFVISPDKYCMDGITLSDMKLNVTEDQTDQQAHKGDLEFFVRIGCLIGRLNNTSSKIDKGTQRINEGEKNTTRSNTGTASISRYMVPELHDKETGRLDARCIQEVFGVSLASLAQYLGKGLSTVAKTPAAPGLQNGLILFERIASALLETVGTNQGLRIWMNASNPELGSKTPLSLCLEGKGEKVVELLEHASGRNLSHRD